MKRTVIFCFALMILAANSFAAFSKDKSIVKTGYNIGPLPVVAYDEDKGFQLGAILQLFNYGDGHNYPNYDSKTFIEFSHFSKGSNLIQLMYDNKELIPGVRWSSAAALNMDKAMDFFGFNGYGSYYNHEFIDAGKNGAMYSYSPFYKFNKTSLTVKSDFIGDITEHLKWEIGYHAYFCRIADIDYDNINKGKSDAQKFPSSVPTLYNWYCQWGLITPEEADGGFGSSIRAGLVYDTRDKEGAPTRGIWAEGHITAAPKWLGSEIPYYRYSLTMRQYFPIIKNDVLTFAYRLNYEGTIGSSAPFYVLPYITVMGENNDKDGMGGYRTVRGVMRDRIVGLDMATYTAELRWRFINFTLWNQNIALGLSAFSDGSMVTRGRDMSFKGNLANLSSKAEYDAYMSKGVKEIPHITFGAGFRFIMNENFIIAAEYGTPLTHFLKNSPVYNQDGTGAFYVNVGYLF